MAREDPGVIPPSDAPDNQPAPPPLRVLVVARNALVRTGLRVLLPDRVEVQVVGEAAGSKSAEVMAGTLQAEALLVAWEHGAAEDVGGLGDPPSPPELGGALHAGVAGFLAAEATADQVTAALRAARSGLLVVDAALGRSLVRLRRSAEGAARGRRRALDGAM